MTHPHTTSLEQSKKVLVQIKDKEDNVICEHEGELPEELLAGFTRED